MKDFVTGREIDIQGLLNVMRAGENQPDKLFDMSSWSDVYDCGTAACLIGSFCLQNPEDALRLRQDGTGSWPTLVTQACTGGNDYLCIQRRFGISTPEGKFLFTARHLDDTYDPYDTNPVAPERYEQLASIDAVELTKDEALRRLRKFIYYKMRKAELLEDYDTARRTGHVGVCQQAVYTEEEVCTT